MPRRDSAVRSSFQMRWAGLVAALVLSMGGAAAGCSKSEAALRPLGGVPAFALKNQADQAFGAAELRGHVWVANFMFTRCPTICPRVTRKVKELQDKAQAQKLDVLWVSFSVDPEHDSPSELASYAQRFGANGANWSFLTGDSATIQRTVVDGFKTALEGKADPNAENYGIIHGTHLILVDRELKIRGYYRTSDDTEAARLLSDIAVLAKP